MAGGKVLRKGQYFAAGAMPEVEGARGGAALGWSDLALLFADEAPSLGQLAAGDL